ncbi:MAG: lysylphosphatidylglycerol synthase transmembrane domain-containing protein [Candidatus Bathyarchaeia archaeon]
MAEEASRRGPSLRKSVILISAGFLVFVAYLYFFVGFSDILEVLEEVNPVNYLFYYSLAIIIVLVSMLFYSMTWHELLRILSVRIRLRESFIYCWIGSFVDLVIPMEAVTGEITRIYLVTRNSKGHVGRIVASTVSHRIISMMTVLVSLIICSASLIFRYKVQEYVVNLLMIVAVGTFASIVLILYLSVRKEATEKIVDPLLRFAAFVSKGHLKLDDLRIRAERTLNSFYQGIDLIGGQPLSLIKPVVFNFASWFFHMAIYILVFYALGFTEISLEVSIVVYSISVAVQTIPIGLPVGLVEIVMTTLYNLFGIPLAVSGTATALIRFVTFWFLIIVGYAITQWIGIKTLMERAG